MNALFTWWKKNSYLLLLGFMILGLVDMRFALIAIICMVAPIVVALFNKGRFWCGNLCPRGNFYDRLVSKLNVQRKKSKTVPKLLNSKFFRVFMILFLFSIFGIGVYRNWGNLYGIGMVIYRIIVITTLVGIALGVYYNHRSWCHFCPMGSIASFISFSKKKESKQLLRVSKHCVSCNLCAKKCPMGISPQEYKGDLLAHPDCIQCGECVLACRKDAIGYTQSNNVKPIPINQKM